MVKAQEENKILQKENESLVKDLKEALRIIEERRIHTAGYTANGLQIPESSTTPSLKAKEEAERRLEGKLVMSSVLKDEPYHDSETEPQEKVFHTMVEEEGSEMDYPKVRELKNFIKRWKSELEEEIERLRQQIINQEDLKLHLRKQWEEERISLISSLKYQVKHLQQENQKLKGKQGQPDFDELFPPLGRQQANALIEVETHSVMKTEQGDGDQTKIKRVLEITASTTPSLKAKEEAERRLEGKLVMSSVLKDEPYHDSETDPQEKVFHTMVEEEGSEMDIFLFDKRSSTEFKAKEKGVVTGKLSQEVSPEGPYFS
ncbi:hypothetical protein L1987_33249 [Smallanthus sonchifolius]|uniref:Uncharacterized protein n=1 Tax=Smallanthus sonchifolius TaxID=185202 RepID=A0ACB9HQ96_9ASTR|nr:hypothetical protein L1987_33249 [Smallanthus sonchifolius]